MQPKCDWCEDGNVAVNGVHYSRWGRPKELGRCTLPSVEPSAATPPVETGTHTADHSPLRESRALSTAERELDAAFDEPGKSTVEERLIDSVANILIWAIQTHLRLAAWQEKAESANLTKSDDNLTKPVGEADHSRRAEMPPSDGGDYYERAANDVYGIAGRGDAAEQEQNKADGAAATAPSSTSSARNGTASNSELETAALLDELRSTSDPELLAGLEERATRLEMELEAAEAALLEVERQSRWIPVSEKLPENSKLVIVYDGGWGAVYITSQDDGVWEQPDGREPPDRITHWRELPAAPPVEREG